MNLIQWIDKDLTEIQNTEQFNDYFHGIGITKIEDDMSMFNEQKGIDLILSRLLQVTSIHLFSGNNPQAKRFQDNIIHDLNFEMDQSAIIRTLGDPKRTGGGYTDIFGEVPIWDKYIYNAYSLHLEYSISTGKLDLITFGSLKLEPHLNSKLQ
jgi:hypothetical protein